MENFLHNYALIYALNSTNPDLDIIRCVSGVRPSYRADFKKVEIYATPAYRISEFKLVGQRSKQRSTILKGKVAVIQDRLISWEELNPIGFTYNSIGESIAFKMEQIKYNFPNLGKYYKLPPLSTFICLTIGKSPPTLVRLGKKYITCRLHSVPLTNIKITSGTFSPSHPVNLNELSPDTQVLEGALVYLDPASLIINGRFKGKYLIGEHEGTQYTIAAPHSEIYPKIFNA